VSGRVEDLAGAYRESAVFANPIRSGGGMRGKLLEAFACGIPVVSTAIGLEGIAARPGEHCDRVDDEDGFAAAILRLLADASLCRARAERARALVVTHYDVGVVLGRLEAAFEAAHAARRAAVGARA
jgi:glycosyltransferase involved in cell wall biosynthesis